MAKGVSLHIGLNVVDPAHYDGWSGPLNACEADAHSMATICEKQGFESRKLLTKAATRAAVAQQLEKLAGSLAGGDTLVISYSGHGGQLPDENKDEDDGLDETWCLFDGQLLDDELYRAWAKFNAGVRIAVFSDSCHSGSVVKNLLLSRTFPDQALMGGTTAATPIYRAMPSEMVTRTYYANQKFYDELLAKPAPPTPTCAVILVSGCQDNQLSMDGPFNGAFTGALLQTWSKGSFKGSYNALAKAIRTELPPTQSPNYMTVGGANDAFADGQAFSI